VLLAALLLLAPLTADASFHTFRIESVYSNADGTVQYVVLRESQNLNNQRFLSTHNLTVTHNGTPKTFTFQTDLPGFVTANRRVLIATQGFADLALITPDYVMPNHFLATEAATLDYAGVDSISYPALPTGGTQALDHGSAAVPAIATNFAGASVALGPLPVTSFEYYNAGLDHYFISDLQPDIDALDSGRIPGWTRTGQSFRVFATAGAGINPVCRFYIPPAHGNSHFFTASPSECATIAAKIGTDPNYSGYVFESPNAFYIGLPNTSSGACPSATAPVYRLWNQRADSNHRYTTDPAIKAQMITHGYVPEGYGPDATIMCAPAPGRSSLRFLQGSSATNGALVSDAIAIPNANYQGYQAAGANVDVGPRNGAGEVIAFSEKRAVALLPVTWSSATGNQIVDVPLLAQLNTPITIWVVAGPFVTTQQTALTLWSTAQQMYWAERMGTALPLEVVDATTNPKAGTWNAFTCGTANASVNAIQADIGVRAGRINVYLVNLVDGSTSRGNACSIGGPFVAIAAGSTADLLAHELGHDYALEHIDDLPLAFDVTNVMHPASSTRAFVTEGQSFRAHTLPASAINAVYALRPGQVTRTCDRDTLTLTCPAIARRLWADGSFGPN
jgi:hypothetical protein